MVNAFRLVNGAPGKHIRLPFQFPVLVQDFQGAEQAVGTVLLKGTLVAGAVQQAVFAGELVIGGVQLLLQVLDLFLQSAV